MAVFFRPVKGVLVCGLAAAFAVCSTGVASAVPTATAPHQSSARASVAAAAASAVFTPVTAQRLLDSSSGTGATAARGTTRLKVAGTAGVPTTGVSTVVLTVTVSRPARSGYLSVFADGSARPATSNVNFAVGSTVADQVYAPVGADGMVSIYNGSSGALRLVVDLSGYFATQSVPAAGAFVTTTPTRILDTSSEGGGGAVGARDTRSVPVLGRGPVPASGVSAVVLTLAAVAPAASGYLTAYRDGAVRPATSNVNFSRGSTTANLVVAQLGTDGKIAIYNGSSGATRVVADVAGYFLAGTPSVPGAFVAISPARILTLQPLVARGVARLGTHISPAIPPQGTSAVVLNVNVSGATASGYATVFPAGAARPATSNLNFAAATTTSGMVAVPIPTEDPFDDPSYVGGPWLYNGSTGSMNVTVDAFGYYLASPGAGAVSGTVTDSTTEHGVGDVTVVAYTPDPDSDEQDWKLNSTTTTAADGSYLLPNMWSGQSYWICFDTRLTTGSAPFTGYAAQCYNTATWPTPGSFDDDSGADPVTVTTGHTTTGIDASLNPISEGGLAGTVTTTAGAALANVAVTITSTNGQFVLDTSSNSSGQYAVSTLPVGSYNVCLHATAAPATQDPYGYVDQCLPSPVTVTAGHVTRGDAKLVAAGGISGHVRTASGGTDKWSSVTLFDHTGVQVGSAVAVNADGSYTIGDVVPGDYSVCFDAGDPALSRPYGYVNQCYKGVAWESNYGPPTGTTTVTVPAGATATAIDATLATAGGLSGKVTNVDGVGLTNVGVNVFDPMHRIVTGDTTNDGTFSIIGLSPSVSYTVCFDGSTTQNPTQSYASQCWKSVAWNGEGSPPPGGTTPVTVTAGATHGGLDVTLTKS